MEKVATPAPVLIAYFDENRLHDYLRMAAAFGQRASVRRFIPRRRSLVSS